MRIDSQIALVFTLPFTQVLAAILGLIAHSVENRTSPSWMPPLPLASPFVLPFPHISQWKLGLVRMSVVIVHGVIV